MRRLVLWTNLVLAGISSQACVGKFLANLLSEENANFKLLEVVPVSNTRILVGFNKPLDYNKGALELGNYSIPGLNLVAVEKGPETNQVYLRLDPNDSVRMQQQLYTLTVNNIKNFYWDDLLPGAENRSKQFMGARWLRATAKCIAPTTVSEACIATGFNTNVTVRVAGDYATGVSYRWRLLVRPVLTEHITWSVETPISTTFDLTSLPTNQYRLELQVKDSEGAWQPAIDLTQYDFTVDNTSVNNIGLANTPGSLTSSTVTAINVVYRNCVSPPDYPNGFSSPCYSPSSPVVDEVPVSYQYRIGYKTGSVVTDCNGGGYTFYELRPSESDPDARKWSAIRATNLPIVENLNSRNGSGCYLIQVIAADNVGNWQCDTTASDATAGACTNPAGPGTGSITDFFDAVIGKPWQESRFLLDNTPPVANFITSTLPVNPTSATSFAVAVDATGLDKYRFRVIGTGFSGVWSADKTPGPSGEIISGAGLSSGNYTIEVIGKDAAGNYQSTSSATSYTFTVDTAAPTASVASRTGTTCNSGKTVSPASPSGLPANPTNENCVDIQVNGVTYYKYKWVTGATCGAGGYYDGPDPDSDPDVFTAATDFISTNYLGWTDGQTYSLCVIGSNNGTLYQGEAETAVTRHTFRYDTTPPVSMISAWVNPAANLSGKSTVVNQLSVSIGKFVSVQNGTTTNASPVVTGLTSTTGMVAGMFVTATSGIPADTRILSVDSATQITLTQNATATGVRSLTIQSEDIQNYKGVITTAMSCPTSAAMVADNTTYPITSPQSPLQATGIGTGTVRICFIARDAAGNWETTTREVNYTRFDPPAPGDGGGASDAQYTNSFNFTWTTGAQIPTGTQKITIRVCKDSTCANALPGMNNGQDVCTSAATCDVTSSFTLNSSCTGLNCIKQANSTYGPPAFLGTYFAQLKVTDSIGQESLFGPGSNGKVVVGQITGVVRNTFNAPIAGATVGVYQRDCTTQIGSNISSAGDGSFTFSLAGGHSLPIILSGDGYCVKVASGTLQGIKKFVESKPGTATNAGTIYAVDTTGTPGCLIGAVVDGSNGSQLLLSNATFALKDFNNATVATTPSLDPDGKQFVFPSACLNSWGSAPYSSPTYTHSSGVSPGVYTLDISIPNYYSISETVAVTTATTTNVGYLPMVGTFGGGSKQIKVILTWGNVFKDLDLHLVGPSSPAYDCQPYNEAAIQNAAGAKFHVSYQQRYCANTGTNPPEGSTSLAVDDSFEYGPEIINFYDGYADGTYKVSVFNNDTPRRVGTTTSGSAVVTGLPSTADLVVGMHVRADTGIPAGTTIASIDSATQITLSANATATGARLLNITRNWNVSRARIDVYAGGYFAGGGGRIATVLSSGSSELRGWRALRLLISGSSLTVDDTTGTGYSDWNYGYIVTRAADRTNGNPNLTNLSTTADLAVGMRIAGPGIPNSLPPTTISSLGATTVTMSKNANSNGVAGPMTFFFNACGGGVINGPSDGLTANALPPAGQSPADPNLDCGLFSNGTTVASGAGPLDW